MKAVIGRHPNQTARKPAQLTLVQARPVSCRETAVNRATEYDKFWE